MDTFKNYLVLVIRIKKHLVPPKMYLNIIFKMYIVSNIGYTFEKYFVKLRLELCHCVKGGRYIFQLIRLWLRRMKENLDVLYFNQMQGIILLLFVFVYIKEKMHIPQECKQSKARYNSIQSITE